jgi:iron complex transport system permease protein
MKQQMRKFSLVMVALGAGLGVVILLSLSLGQETIPFARVGQYIWDALAGRGGDEPARIILISLRWPRLLSGLISGACLAMAGAVFQGLLRNPLAEPYILGVSSGAALGVAAGVIFEVHLLLGFYTIPFLAVGGALFTMGLIYSLSRTGARFSMFSMILAGVIVNAIMSAAIMFIMSLSTDRQLHSIVFWLMGRLDIADARLNGVVGVVALAAMFVVYYYARDLNVMTLGEDDAHYLGVNVERVKRILFVAASVLTACAVSISGIIGFVGLLVPHFARAVVGPDHRLSYPVAVVSGPLLLCLADIVARTVAAPAEIPVGVVTALVGGPFFLFILKRKQSSF